MNALRAEQGDSTAFVVTLNDDQGNPYTAYTGTETVTAVVWAGNEAAPITGAATAAFLSAAAGTVNLTLVGAVTSALVPGIYWVKIEVDGARAWVAELEIEAAPGSTAARTAYVTVRHLRKHYRNVDKLLGGKEFADDPQALQPRADAWDELVSLAHRHYRGASGLSTDFAFVPGISFAGTYGLTWYPRDGRRSAELQTWLDAGRLDLTTEVLDFMALSALARILSGMVSNAEDKGGYLAMARRFEARATILAQTMTLELDSDGDGVNDTTIRLGSADTLES